MDAPVTAPMSPPAQRRSTRVEVNGWVVLDKPVGITSTHAVARLKRLFNAKKAGHAGTLDPLASGILPIAFGEATKTVPFVQDGEKAYRFTVRWGAETDTDDADGRVVETADARPAEAAIRALLPQFVGTILQKPPAYSALKVDGERAYDRARDGEIVDLAPRPVTIHALDLVEAGAEEAVFEARCTKGTYVRAIARDLGRALGCRGHVSALRRTRVGPFLEADAVPLAALLEGPEAGALRRVEAGLTEVARVVVDRTAAARLRRGQPVLLRGADAPAEGVAYAACGGTVVALGSVEAGELVPSRVFNLPF
jgi:tRNA pseudouridine55 synthase